MARIGFIGLGNMGGGMAANLAKSGHEVRASDLSEAALAKAEERGGNRAADGAAAADGAQAGGPQRRQGRPVGSARATSAKGRWQRRRSAAQPGLPMLRQRSKAPKRS